MLMLSPTLFGVGWANNTDVERQIFSTVLIAS